MMQNVQWTGRPEHGQDARATLLRHTKRDMALSLPKAAGRGQQVFSRSFPGLDYCGKKWQL
jgi:hypothetical protein